MAARRRARRVPTRASPPHRPSPTVFPAIPPRRRARTPPPRTSVRVPPPPSRGALPSPPPSPSARPPSPVRRLDPGVARRRSPTRRTPTRPRLGSCASSPVSRDASSPPTPRRRLRVASRSALLGLAQVRRGRLLVSWQRTASARSARIVAERRAFARAFSARVTASAATDSAARRRSCVDGARPRARPRGGTLRWRRVAQVRPRVARRRRRARRAAPRGWRRGRGGRGSRRRGCGRHLGRWRARARVRRREGRWLRGVRARDGGSSSLSRARAPVTLEGIDGFLRARQETRAVLELVVDLAEF